MWIDGGTFVMGSDRHYPAESPSRTVTVDGFWIDVHPVTNAQFARFVAETGHVTVSEIPPRAEDYPGAIPEQLVAASSVFTMTDGPVPLTDHFRWWQWVPGADWRHPTGPDSSIDGLDDHPVVQVAYDDVLAYAAWAGMDLPTEAEWEYAARGGLDQAEFAWGDHDPQETPEALANTWQGRFPYENTAVDGWVRTSPVGAYPPNGHGLVDMIGNVWEWTTDFYRDEPVGGDDDTPCCGQSREVASYDPAMPEIKIPRRVIKGGSHLCTTQYCFRYRPAARQPQAVDTGTSHVGFRCIRRQPRD